MVFVIFFLSLVGYLLIRQLIVYNNTNANFISNTEYTNSNLQLTAPIAPFAPGYVSCMSEPINGRALNATSLTQANMTVEICASFCSGYKYYGVEYSSQVSFSHSFPPFFLSFSNRKVSVSAV